MLTFFFPLLWFGPPFSAYSSMPEGLSVILFNYFEFQTLHLPASPRMKSRFVLPTLSCLLFWHPAPKHPPLLTPHLLYSPHPPSMEGFTSSPSPELKCFLRVVGTSPGFSFHSLQNLGSPFKMILTLSSLTPLWSSL